MFLPSYPSSNTKMGTFYPTKHGDVWSGLTAAPAAAEPTSEPQAAAPTCRHAMLGRSAHYEGLVCSSTGHVQAAKQATSRKYRSGPCERAFTDESALVDGRGMAHGAVPAGEVKWDVVHDWSSRIRASWDESLLPTAFGSPCAVGVAEAV